jgi:hypothetical protein
MSAAVDRFGPGEYLVWQGRPRWAALARDVLHVRPVALYLGVVWIWIAATNRNSGLSPMDTLAAGAPLALVSSIVVGACLAFGFGLARTTRYTLTNQRLIMHYGLALTATLSIPLRQVASVAIAERSDGTGDLPLQLKPGKRIGYIKLWPHVRPWHTAHPAPMLRCVPDAARVGLLLSQTVEAVNAGRRYLPVSAARAGVVQAPAGVPAHG